MSTSAWCRPVIRAAVAPLCLAMLVIASVPLVPADTVLLDGEAAGAR
ncbi:hypothetical protein [Micromonospora sp. SH-82]